MQSCLRINFYDSFVKFWPLDCIDAHEIVLKKCTVVFHQKSIPILKDCRRFIVTHCYFKNPNFAWRPTTEKL